MKFSNIALAMGATIVASTAVAEVASAVAPQAASATATAARPRSAVRDVGNAPNDGTARGSVASAVIRAGLH